MSAASDPTQNDVSEEEKKALLPKETEPVNSDKNDPGSGLGVTKEPNTGSGPAVTEEPSNGSGSAVTKKPNTAKDKGPQTTLLTRQTTIVNMYYESTKDVPCTFWACSVLWCGCCAPRYYITDKVIEINRCICCGWKMDSLLYDNIRNVSLEKPFCFTWCCPCFEDIGDIYVHMGDRSKKKGSGDALLKLKYMFKSTELFDDLTVLLQEKHKKVRLDKRFGYYVEEKKNEYAEDNKKKDQSTRPKSNRETKQS